MLGRFKQKRGDTMIEVMLSVAIFSVVAIMGLTIMNQGSTAAQRSLEITLVRQEMDAQIEALRFMYDAAVAQKTAPGFNASAVATGSPAAKWNAVLGYRWVAGNNATEFSSMTTGVQCKTPAAIRSERSAGATTGDIFVINTRTATAIPYAASTWGVTPLYSRALYDNSNNISRVEGIWIEGVRVNARTEAATGVRTPGYTDFHVRACWSTVGQAPPITLGTIVRLYEP